MPVSIILACFCFVGQPAGQAEGSGPGPRYGHRAVWDSARQLTVVFGGRGSNKLSRGDTWGWDGSRWQQLATGGPSPRAWVGLAYDQRRGVVVLFGGRDSSQAAQADTWEWDGRQWRLAAGPSSEGPGPRDHPAMAYDPIQGRVVLHGGVHEGQILSDLWEWDGRRWSRGAADNPGDRVAHSLAWDPGRSALVFFGGRFPVANDIHPAVPNDTWVRERMIWRRLPVPVEGRSHTALAWDPGCGCLFRFGGGDQPRMPRDDTWRLEGDTWRKVATRGPAARVDHVTVYDPIRKLAWLYGGYRPEEGGPLFGDLWNWDGQVWRCVAGC